MEIFILQYALAILICLWSIEPFKRVTFGKHVKVPLLSLLCIFVLFFTISYSLADEIRSGTNIAFIGDKFFLWINLVLFLLVPAAYIFLKAQYYKRKFRKHDLYHLVPGLLYAIGFIAPYFLFDQDFLTGESNTSFFFKIFGYCTVSIYILLVMRFLFYKYLPFPNESRAQKPVANSPEEKRHNHHDLDHKEVFIGSVHLTEEQLTHMDDTLRNYFVAQQPFLKRGYNLKQLSDETSIPLHHLSAFINQYYHRNFNDFINEYRVLYCQNKIKNDEWRSKTLEAIAEESGFNNRNTFTAAFKKVTGCNPSDFLRMVKQKQIA